MSNKTINKALTDLFIGLGGNVSALADNKSVSDYIADLENAIKAYVAESAGAVLPAVTADDKDKELMVLRDGDSYLWGIGSLINDESSQGTKHTYSIDKIRELVATQNADGGKLNSVDLDDMDYRKTNKVFKLVDLSNLTNAPAATGTGILKVYNPFPSQAWCIQEVIAFDQTAEGVISNYAIYTRHYMSDTLGWSNWFTASLTEITNQ